MKILVLVFLVGSIILGVVVEEKIKTESSNVDDFIPESMKLPNQTVIAQNCYTIEESKYNNKMEVCLDIVKEVQYCCGNNCSPLIKACQGCQTVCTEGHVIK